MFGDFAFFLFYFFGGLVFSIATCTVKLSIRRMLPFKKENRKKYLKVAKKKYKYRTRKEVHPCEVRIRPNIICHLHRLALLFPFLFRCAPLIPPFHLPVVAVFSFFSGEVSRTEEMAQKKGPRVSEDPEELSHVPLQAILLADSFAQKFRPITLERPKVSKSHPPFFLFSSLFNSFSS